MNCYWYERGVGTFIPMVCYRGLNVRLKPVATALEALQAARAYLTAAEVPNT